VINEDNILRETRLSKKRQSLERERERLQKQKESLAQLEISEERIKSFYREL